MLAQLNAPSRLRGWVAILGIALPSATGIAQQTRQPAFTSAAWGQATAALDRYVRSDSIVGAGLALVINGRVVADHYVGYADRDRGTLAGPQTIWHWGSITKTLTGVAAMQQVELGRLAISDSATRWIPELRRIHSEHGSVDAITVRMLMSHSSGLQNPTWTWGNGATWQPFEPTEWSQLVAMMPYQQLLFSPGTRYSYSNPGVLYLARIVEQLSGDPWQGYIHKQLFAPLAMNHSYFGATPAYLSASRSHNYEIQTDGRVIDQGADFDPGITIPNGGWNAPIGDIARWVGFLTARTQDTSTASAESILKRATLEKMWQPVVEVSADESMGLSFFIRKGGGPRIVGHTGEQANFRSLMYLRPDNRTGIIAVVNTSHARSSTAETIGFQQLLRASLDVLNEERK